MRDGREERLAPCAGAHPEVSCRRLARRHPGAPWNDLPEEVRAAILERADRSPVCAAIAAARGRRDAATTNKTYETAAAFFAALDPRVWDALDADTQRSWRRSLEASALSLAVRSLGLRPEFLARALPTDTLARAVRQHARTEEAWRAALFPVALRMVDPESAHALSAAMPMMPPDPGAFFVSAGGRADPALIAPAGAALRSPADLALAVVLQRSGGGDASIRARADGLRRALRGRSWADLGR